MNYKSGMISSVLWIMISVTCLGQSKTGDQRMQQDIEVAENILGTLLRQETGRRGFFPVDVKGTYMPGYGVTFRMPVSYGMNSFVIAGVPEPDMVEIAPGGISYSWSRTERGMEELAALEEERALEAEERARREDERAREMEELSKREDERVRAVERERARVRAPRPPRSSRDRDDSASFKAQKRFMDVAKNFLADYGDVISGLKPDERITITNRGDNFEGAFAEVWFNGRKSKQQMMSVEARRGDIEQLKQGKISRAEFLNRLKVVNTESTDAVDPDLEVLSSLFGRLYREDLSKTYYVQGNINYERLKDFGVMYYMKVYSSLEMDDERFVMPTLDLRGVSQEERDKKVKELYPRFESELKDNIVDYGRTLRSLKDEEQLVFSVRLTKCDGCGIPATLELSIKASALKDYSAGKASREATLAKINVKKTGVQ
ncbi:MAG: hypothetical protein JNN04_11485 [Cyclobacteriaceae bacterium]|nr:hypothetical protein [Cyclobacteriaceae bacterium]